MKRILIALAFLAGLGAAGEARAAVCTLPYILQNGVIPNAQQIMADFYALQNCITASAGSVTSLTSGTCITLVPNPITVSGTIGLTIPITVPCGGTGRGTLTAHNVIIGADTSAVTLVAPGAAGTVLTSNGTGSDPSFQPGGGGGGITGITVAPSPCIVSTPSPIAAPSGTITLQSPLSVPCGGTGDATLTNHGVMVGQGTSAVAVTSAGTAGQVLTSNGASADPTFQALGAGSCGGVNQIACLNLDQAWTARQQQSPVALTDGSTISTDASLRNYFSVTLTGNNHTLANPTNLQPGNYVWYISTGAGFTGFAVGSEFKFSGNTPTWSTGASKKDVIACVADTTATLNCTALIDVGGTGGALSLTDGHIFVGNSSNLAADVAMTGDCTIADTGIITCTSGGGITIGTTPITSGTNGRVLFDNSGVVGEKTVTGSGNAVLATSPTMSGVTVTGSFTATGLVTNADLANSSTTVSGTTCTLGSSCSPQSTAPLSTGSSTGNTFTAPKGYFVCTASCTVTPPVPAAGYEFCLLQDDNTSGVLTFGAIGSSARYENTARTAYGTAGTGTLASAGATGESLCIVGRDSTHYLTMTFSGTWTAN